MSETSAATSTGLGTGAPSSGASLFGPSGERLPRGGNRFAGQSDQVGDFVMQQPMTAALVALIVGYFLGKLT